MIPVRNDLNLILSVIQHNEAFEHELLQVLSLGENGMLAKILEDTVSSQQASREIVNIFRLGCLIAQVNFFCRLWFFTLLFGHFWFLPPSF